jgi:hypothetical protein
MKRVVGLSRISIGAYELREGDRRAILRRHGDVFRIELGAPGLYLHPKFLTLSDAIVATRYYWRDLEDGPFPTLPPLTGGVGPTISDADPS